MWFKVLYIVISCGATDRSKDRKKISKHREKSFQIMVVHKLREYSSAVSSKKKFNISCYIIVLCLSIQFNKLHLF